MKQDWKVVYTTNKIYEAEMLKSLLTEHKIECVSVNKMDSSYLIGDIDIMVPFEQATEAEQLIPLFNIE